MSQVNRSHPSKNRSPAPQVIDRVASAASSVSSVVNEAATKSGLAERVAQNPYGVTAAALAVGYIAGGGLFTRSTARLFAFAAELSRVPMVRTHVLELFEGVLDSVVSRASKCRGRS